MSLEPYRTLLDKRPLAHVAVVGPDGLPHTTPVWLDLHDGKLRFTTVKGRVKHRCLLSNPGIAISLSDPDDPFPYIQVRGRAVISDDPEATLLQKLWLDYTGAPYPPNRPKNQRVIVTVEAAQVSGTAA